MSVLVSGAVPATAAGGSGPSTTITSSQRSGTGAKKAVVTFGTQTAGANAPDKRGIFSFGATPGGQIDDHIAVINYSEQPITVSLLPVDAVNTPQGGFAALPVNETSHQVGTWITLPPADRNVTLAPRSDRIVPFTLKVPQDTTPGDHFGVITATLASSVISGSGAKVQLFQTVGTRVFLRVSGPLHPGFSIEDLRIHYSGTANPVGAGTAVLSYRVRNTGNVALGGQQGVSISGLFGSQQVARHLANLQLLLPGSSVTERVRFSGVIPEIRETAHVKITPLYIAGVAEPASRPFVASVGFWAIPWTLIAIALGLVALALLLVRRRRRKGQPGRGGNPPTLPARGGRSPVRSGVPDSWERGERLPAAAALVPDINTDTAITIDTDKGR